MIIRRDIEQGSLGWLEARAGVVTASEFGNLVTPGFEIRDGEMPKTYLAQKLAEKIGGPMLSFSSFATEQGECLEDEARAWLALEMDREIEQVGFCTTDDGRAGCSPDGIIGEEGLELKAPQSVNHVKWLLAGGAPKEHLAQIHFGMFVTGFASWRFVSYRRGFPALVVVVKRDEKIQKILGAALRAFLERFDAGLNRLKDLAVPI